MATSNVVILGNELGLTNYGSNAMGIVGKWPVMTYPQLNRFSVVVDAKRTGDAFKHLKSMAKTWGSKVLWEKQTISFTVGNPNKMPGTLTQYARACLSCLEELGIQPAANCPICGQPGCDNVSFVGGGFRQTHRRCLEGGLENAKSYAEKNQSNGSYLSGIVGAILGMIVGTIPTFLSIVGMETIWSLLFALIPICAYFGYKLLGGKMNKAALVVSVVCAIVGVFIINFEVDCYYVMKEYGLSLGESLEVLLTAMMEPEYYLEIIKGSISEFIFALLGVWIAWRVISGTAAGGVNNAASALQMAMPYPAAPAAQPAESGESIEF